MPLIPRPGLLKEIAILSILVPIFSFAQVNIKEKVEIKPGQSTIKSISDLPPLELTNTVTLPFDGDVFVQSVLWAPYASHEILKMNGVPVLWDLQRSPYQSLGSHVHGEALVFEIEVRDTTPEGVIKTQTIPITAIQPLYEWGPCMSGQLYELGGLLDDGNGNKSFVDFSVMVGVGGGTPGGPPTSFVAWDVYTYFGFQPWVQAQFMNTCGYGSYVPGIAMKAEIVEGAEWGDLVDASGREVKKIDSLDQENGMFLIYYRAWRKEPQQEERAVIHLISNDGKFETTANVFIDPYPFPLKVTPGRSQIQAGDTTKIDIQMTNLDGTPTGELQSATYRIVEGDTLAFLYSPDSSAVGSEISGVFPTARLYIPIRPDLPASFDVVVSILGEEPCPDCEPASIVVPSQPDVSNRSPGKAVPVNTESGKLSDAVTGHKWAAPFASKSESAGQRPATRKDSIMIAFNQRIADEMRTKIKQKIPAVSRPANPDQPGSRVAPARIQYTKGHRGWVRITVTKKMEILLGETKYYYARKDEAGNLNIEETTNPDLGKGISSVIMEDPVIAADAVNNDKVGVYWDYFKPSGAGLDNGVIRLIGRYWKQDTTYNVKLRAVLPSDGSTASAEIEVTKPARLGNDYGPLGNGDRRRTVSDVYGHQYNLDSVIIKYAGQYGIPPQVLKADMEQEGNFQPAYRWEPFVDADIQHKQLKYMDDDFRYRKTNSTEGTPGIPTNHTNVTPPYPRNDYRIIWDKFFSESKVLNSDPNVTNRYPMKSWWTGPAVTWNEKYNKKLLLALKQKMSLSDARDNAREYANEWLRDEYQDGVMSDGIAQTRSAASYGLMQLMYPTAVDMRRYPFDRTDGRQDHLPEYINFTDTCLTYAVPYMLSKINVELDEEGDGAGKPGNWTLGFERTIVVALNMYNGKTAREPQKKRPDTRYNWHYGFDVFSKVYQYLPRDK